MMRKTLIVFVMTGLVLGVGLPAAQAVIGSADKKILDNGLTVLVKEMPSSPMVSVYGLVKTGAATEGKFLGSGISHFLEHMLFKGTHGRSVGELASRIQAVGGTINASTGMDYTLYTITVPHESFDVGLDILADMLMNATMEEYEVENERNVILGEMRMRNDDPDRKHSEMVFQNVYINHPYRHPIIGYESLLNGLTRDDLVEYYRTKYTPNNTIISIAGRVDGAKAMAKVAKAFKDFRRSRSSFRNLPVEPDQITSRYYEEEYPTELARLSISFSSVRLLHPDLYALDVLASILGQGRSSRLYQDVFQNKGLVHHITASNYTPIDKGLFGIACFLDPQKLDGAIEAILENIEEIKGKGATKDELARVKEQIRSGHILQYQTTSSVARAMAIDEAFAGDHLFTEKYLDAIDRVTLEDVQRVAKEYLTESAMTTVILKPLSQEPGRKSDMEWAKDAKIQKHVLKNGLTVLLKEDPSMPVVSLRLVAGGGTRQETEDLNGLSQMVSSVWIKGTKHRDAKDIAEYTEGLGMRLESFSGRNSFGVELEFLSGQWPHAIDLLKEFVFSPAFDDREVERIRTQLKAAIKQRDDNIFQASAMVLKQTLFQTHPFRLEKEGTVETVEAITRSDVVGFYDRHMVAKNMVLSVFGDINAEETLKQVRNTFRSVNPKDIAIREYSEKPPEETREETFTMNKTQAMVMIGFQGPEISDEDYYGMEVLSTVLGSPFNGRIFRNIRDQMGKAYTLGGQYIPAPDIGFVYFFVQTTEEDVERVKDMLIKEVKQMHIIRASEGELRAVKTYLKGMKKASQETVSSLSFSSSLNELYGVGFDRDLQYDAKIDAVTSEGIQRLAKQYLNPEKMAVVITVPGERR